MATGARINVIYKALGLFTFGNQFDAPEGAMQKALDVVIDRPGVVESRPDFAQSEKIPSAGTGVNQGTCNIFTTTRTQDYAANLATYTSAGGAGWVYNPYGGLGNGAGLITTVDYLGNSGTMPEVHSAFAANGNDYFLTGGSVGGQSLGPNPRVYRLDANTGAGTNTCRSTGAGMPEGLTPVDYTGTGTGTGVTGLPTAASTVLAGASGGQRAYRIVFATKDLQLNLVRGPPSGRHIVYSTSAYTYGLLIPLPRGQVFAGDIVQVYASEVATAQAGSEPSDSLAQVYEYILTATDITNGYTTFQDSAAAAYGPALYTNDTQDGILMAEARPPDAALGIFHKNVAWYGGVRGKGQQGILTILGLNGWSTTVGSETQFTIAGTTYKAATAEDLPNHKFQLFTAGSAAQNIANTARSLARAISWNNTFVYAFYATPANSIQFQIVIKTMSVGDYATRTLTGANVPNGTVAPTLPLTLKDDAKASRLYYSRPNQPESVPDQNYQSIGSPDIGITGLASLRDSLFVFKQDGLFRVTGTTSNDIRVELFDPTVKMEGGYFRSIAVAGNQCFALCNKGVVSITESGVTVISDPIDDIVKPYTTQPLGLGTLQIYPNKYPYPAIGAASETDNKYFLVLTALNTGSLSASAGSQRMLVYNFLRQNWVEWTPPTHCAGMASCAIQNVYGEVAFAVADNHYTQSYYQLGTLAYKGAAAFSYCVEDTENPGVLKRFYDVRVMLTQSAFSGTQSLSCIFSSDSGASPVTVTQSVSSAPYAAVFQVPREHAECGQLNFTIAAPSSGRMVVQCVNVSYDILSDRLPGARG